MKSLLRTDEEWNELYNRQKNTVYRLCFAYMKNYADAEDALQETFIRLVRRAPVFENETHEKAWLIRTASNVCKNMLRSPRRRAENIEDYRELRAADDAAGNDVLNAVLALPEKYKTAVYLYYYEGYSSVEIARMLQKPQSTVRTYLGKARELLKSELDQ